MSPRRARLPCAAPRVLLPRAARAFPSRLSAQSEGHDGRCGRRFLAEGGRPRWNALCGGADRLGSRRAGARPAFAAIRARRCVRRVGCARVVAWSLLRAAYAFCRAVCCRRAVLGAPRGRGAASRGRPRGCGAAATRCHALNALTRADVAYTCASSQLASPRWRRSTARWLRRRTARGPRRRRRRCATARGRRIAACAGDAVRVAASCARRASCVWATSTRAW